MNHYGYFSIHAEACAILKASGKGDTLFVVRILKDGSLTCSKPCEKCYEFIKNFGIKKVYYTNWEGVVEELRF